MPNKSIAIDETTYNAIVSYAEDEGYTHNGKGSPVKLLRAWKDGELELVPAANLPPELLREKSPRPQR